MWCKQLLNLSVPSEARLVDRRQTAQHVPSPDIRYSFSPAAWQWGEG
ncbi:hypothetical protein OAH05_00695 [bacterium]|nr:hypothetical protein [bacterium]